MKKTESNLLPDAALNKAAECLKVMAHPVRLKMVELLLRGEYAVHELADLCRTTPNQTCEHLRLLKGHGLLTSERRGKTVYYKVIAPQLPGLIECIRKNCGLAGSETALRHELHGQEARAATKTLPEQP